MILSICINIDTFDSKRVKSILVVVVTFCKINKLYLLKKHIILWIKIKNNLILIQIQDGIRREKSYQNTSLKTIIIMKFLL